MSVYVKMSMQGIPGRGMIKREGGKGVIYSTISMCTCGQSPGYMRSGQKGLDRGVLTPNPEWRTKAIRGIELR